MKKKIIIFLLVMIITIIPVLSFAYTLPDIWEYNHFVIIKYNDNSYGAVLLKPEVEDVSPSEDLSYGDTLGLRIGSRSHRFVKSNDGITWVQEVYMNNYTIPGFGTYQIIDSSFDVKYLDGTVFFSPPKPLLVETMEGVDSGMILKIILDGLTLLLGFLVLAICLRKGWAFLRRQLTT